MTDLHDLSELMEIMRLGLREQSIHLEGLNSSQTHGTLYPVGDPRNDKTPQPGQPTLTSSKLMRTGTNSRRNWV